MTCFIDAYLNKWIGYLYGINEWWMASMASCICSTCWDQYFSELVVILPDYALRISLGTFSISRFSDTPESNTSASYLDLLLSIESDGQLRTSLYDKRDDFNFHITNFPFLSSNIPSSPAYGVFISQLIRYARVWPSYECFILRAAQLSSKLVGHGYVMERLKSSLRKFYGRYGDLIKHYEVSLSQMLHDILGHDRIQWHPQLISLYTNLRTYYRTGLYYRFWPYYQILEVSIEHCNGCG